MSTVPHELQRVPFTVVDEAIAHLDTQTEPWSIEVEVGLEGRLDEERLRRAVGEAVQKHPMSRVRQLPARRSERSYTWEITKAPDLDPVAVVDCPDEAGLGALRDSLQSVAVPRVESPPFRLRLAHGPDGDVLLLNANHAAFDGFACVRLLQSVGRAYAGRPDPLADVDLEDARDVERHLATEDRAARAQRFRALGEKIGDLGRPPARLAPDGGDDAPGYRIFHDSLSADDTRALAEIEHEGTLNDVLMAGLHLAIQRWNDEHGEPTAKVGVLMPVNLRPKEWQDEVVTNFVLETRISTSRTDRESPRSALAAVTSQTQNIKQWGTGAALIEVLGRTSHLPLWAKQSLSPLLWLTGNRLVDTAVLSNLGKVSDPPSFGPDAGDTTGIFFSAPCRLPCGLSIGAVTVDGRLHLSYRWRRPVAGHDAARRFADRYLETLDGFRH